MPIQSHVWKNRSGDFHRPERLLLRRGRPTSAVTLAKGVRIGVISDTHGLVRPEAIAALQGSDFIIHAGDIGKSEVLDELARIAPVTAVRGNVDRDAWAAKLPECSALEVGEVSVYVLHNLAELDLKPETCGFKVVVHGHSHVPAQVIKEGVLYFNPGSAGPRRFKLPVSVGRITIHGLELSTENVVLQLTSGV